MAWLLSFCFLILTAIAHAEIVVVPGQDVAELVPADDRRCVERTKLHVKRYRTILNSAQFANPLIQNILKKSGCQPELPNPFALLDISCFKNKYGSATFESDPARAEFKPVCNQHKNPSGGAPVKTFKITKPCETLFVDYSIDQNKQRGWLLDTCAGKVLRGPFSVAQGRGDGPEGNTKPGATSNTIYDPATYTSNVPDTNASASGFFVATQKYKPNNVGPAMNMQGVELGINENACDRRTVVHGAKYVDDNSAEGLSKGCISLDDDTNTLVHDAIAGPGENIPGRYEGGGLIYVYTEREKEKMGTNCGRGVMEYKTPSLPRPRPPNPN